MTKTFALLFFLSFHSFISLAANNQSKKTGLFCFNKIQKIFSFDWSTPHLSKKKIVSTLSTLFNKKPNQGRYSQIKNKAQHTLSFQISDLLLVKMDTHNNLSPQLLRKIGDQEIERYLLGVSRFKLTYSNMSIGTVFRPRRDKKFFYTYKTEKFFTLNMSGYRGQSNIVLRKIREDLSDLLLNKTLLKQMDHEKVDLILNEYFTPSESKFYSKRELDYLKNHWPTLVKDFITAKKGVTNIKMLQERVINIRTQHLDKIQELQFLKNDLDFLIDNDKLNGLSIETFLIKYDLIHSVLNQNFPDKLSTLTATSIQLSKLAIGLRQLFLGYSFQRSYNIVSLNGKKFQIDKTKKTIVNEAYGSPYGDYTLDHFHIFKITDLKSQKSFEISPSTIDLIDSLGLFPGQINVEDLASFLGVNFIENL